MRWAENPRAEGGALWELRYQRRQVRIARIAPGPYLLAEKVNLSRLVLVLVHQGQMRLTRGEGLALPRLLEAVSAA